MKASILLVVAGCGLQPRTAEEQADVEYRRADDWVQSVERLERLKRACKTEVVIRSTLGKNRRAHHRRNEACDMRESPLTAFGRAVRKILGANLSRKLTGAIASSLIAGCAAQYDPERAFSVQDQLRNADPRLNCPAGSVVACEIEGGAIVGKTYSNCRCIR